MQNRVASVPPSAKSAAPGVLLMSIEHMDNATDNYPCMIYTFGYIYIKCTHTYIYKQSLSYSRPQYQVNACIPSIAHVPAPSQERQPMEVDSLATPTGIDFFLSLSLSVFLSLSLSFSSFLSLCLYIIFFIDAHLILYDVSIFFFHLAYHSRPPLSKWEKPMPSSISQHLRP